MLTNVWFARKGPPHRLSGREAHPVVAAYRTLWRGVNGVNQMALQMRHVGRQMTWAHAVRAFVLRYAVVNAFATCRQLGLCKETTSMLDWKWQVLRRRYFAHPLRQEVPVPVATQRRLVCHFCKRGRTSYECTGCGKAFHLLCFAPGHGYGGVQGARDMEVDQEHEEVWEEHHEEDVEDGDDEEDEEDE